MGWEPETVAVLGAGRLGRALARWLARGGHRVQLWSRRGPSGPPLPGVEWASQVTDAALSCQTLLLAVPAGAVRSIVEQMADCLRPDHEIVHACKGVGDGFTRVSEVIRSECGVRKIAALGGPLVATELDAGQPQAITVASRFDRVTEHVRSLMAGPRTWLFGTRDIVGVELAGAMRNVSAIAMGIAEALDISEPSRAFVLTRGLYEAAHLGLHLGASRDTFLGLSGVGDLVARREATYSRNFRLGVRVARGEPVERVMADLSGEAEGVATAREASALQARTGLTLEVARAVARVCGGTDARIAIDDLLSSGLPLELAEGLSRQ